ncbi:DUF4221 family protein [Echinicola salinicaeni]|uniref:DUF4221 family protein n=1 Tax=Echinicola salinicaeni TaxID=2762757 RepID=UPI00164513CC|nr:DUF4221 family protein [Echinicola salinicaeni]
MKKLFFAALPFLIASCYEKTSEETSSLSDNAGKKFTLEVVDTLFIDSGEDIILIENQNARTDFSDDLKYYFNYNYKQNLIDVINLKEHKLERQIPFETEGPNGTTSYVSSIDHFDQDKFMINNFNGLVQVFDSNAQKLKSLQLNNETLNGDTLKPKEKISTFGYMGPNGDTYYSFYERIFEGPRGMAIIDMKSKTLTKIPVDGLDAIKDFYITMKIKGGTQSTSPSFYFLLEGNKILLSNGAINELFVYNIDNDSVTHHTYSSKLTVNSLRKPSKNTAHSQEESNKLYQEMGHEVSFQRFIADPEHKRYYRISHGKNGSTWTGVLTVFDENFQQISENKLPESFYISNSFVKDGQIFSQHNIEDELAFVVMEIKEI